MKYEEVKRMSREEADLAFHGGNPTEIVNALLSMAYYDSDWRWVQERCLEFLRFPNEVVCGTAVTCLGHLARIHRHLDLIVVLPALQELLHVPTLAGKVEDAMDDISLFVRT
jgi:hypothetical protein